MKRADGTCETPLRIPIYTQWKSQKGGRKKRVERIFEEILVRNFQNLMKKSSLCTHAVQ
jgi:hypothetical protein